MPHPQIIQGGMGVGVSGWRLSRAVSLLGQLGVVSGTAMAVILARRLQLGDPDGQMRRAIERFPVAGVGQRILDKYYISGGKPPSQPFKLLPFPAIQFSPELVELTVLGNFVEIFLAKDGHDGLVGVNYLEKVQIATLPSLFGAMLAGVDYVLMGAGVPRSIPGVLDRLAVGESVQLKVDVADLPAGQEVLSTLDPAAFFGGAAPRLKRPAFLAIVASATLAGVLARKSNGRVDGFIVEGPSAGGHNAPPRGQSHLNARGEPIYGTRDVPDIQAIRALGLPFWMAGSFGEPGKLAEAIQMGAAGIQVGTAFAFCEESGIAPELKQRVIEQVCAGPVDVKTDPTASPTGFPFKVVQIGGTLSDPAVYAERNRGCDIGYLRSAYRRSDDSVGFRCPAEPLGQYERKLGNPAETAGRKCICNALLSTAGLGQVQADGEIEKPILTAGEDISHIARFLTPPKRSYVAADVIRYLLNGHSQ